MVRYGGMGMQGSASRWLTHIGMLLATLAFASWWMSHTILDTGRTERVTKAVLEDENLRQHLANVMAPVVAQAVNTSASTNVNESALARQRITAVLDDPEVRTKLETFIAEAHARLIGERPTPAVLDKGTVDALVTAAFPTISAADLARVPAVTVDVPQLAAFNSSRHAFHNRFGLYALGALVALTLAFVTSRDRRATLKLVGRWLIGISIGHLIVLWILPVMVVPNVTNNPWAGLVAGVARALNAGLVTGLLITAVAGIALLLVDVLIPSVDAAPATAG